MTEQEKKYQEEIWKRLQYGATNILFSTTLNATMIFHLN